MKFRQKIFLITHGRDQWIARVEDLSEVETRKMKEFLVSTAFSYLRKQWGEVAMANRDS